MWTGFGGPMPDPVGSVTRPRERDSTEAYVRRAVEELQRREPRAPAPGPRPGRGAALRWRLRWRLWPSARHA